jgi:hypothetical protein
MQAFSELHPGYRFGPPAFAFEVKNEIPATVLEDSTVTHEMDDMKALAEKARPELADIGAKHRFNLHSRIPSQRLSNELRFVARF